MSDFDSTRIDMSSALVGFVDNLDRNVLGRFVTNSTLLADANSSFSRAITSFVTGTRLSKTDKFVAHFRDVECVNVIAELWFWWLRTENKEVIRQVENYRKLWFASEFNGVEFPHNINERISQLSLVVDHPDYHDYFAAEIWDVEFIDRCIADNVDAALARELVTS